MIVVNVKLLIIRSKKHFYFYTGHSLALVNYPLGFEAEEPMANAAVGVILKVKCKSNLESRVVLNLLQ